MASRSIQPVTSVSAGPPCGGLYLKPPSPGGLCDGVTTMPSAAGGCARLPPRLWVRIACEMTGVGVYAAGRVDHDVDAVRGEHLDDRAERRLGQRVRVAAEVQRPARALLGPEAADRGADGDDVRLGERAVERRAAMAGRAEGDGRGGRVLAVGGEQRVDIDEVAVPRQLARARIHAHAAGQYRSARAPEGLIVVAGEALIDLVPAAGGRSPRTRAAGRSTPPARSAGSSARSPTWAGSRPTASAPGSPSLLAADGVRLDAHVRTDDPTTLALVELAPGGSAATASTPRAPPRLG